MYNSDGFDQDRFSKGGSDIHWFVRDGYNAVGLSTNMETFDNEEKLKQAFRKYLDYVIRGKKYKICYEVIENCSLLQPKTC